MTETEKIMNLPAELSCEELLKQVRVIRNNLLINSDWTQLPDNSLNIAQIEAWKTYRQALRNLPDNIDENIKKVKDVVFPEKPE